MISKQFLIVPLFLFLGACGSKTQPAGAEDGAPAKEAEVHTRTPVTVTQVEMAPIAESIELNATSTFIKKNEVRCTSTGYIEKILVQLGDHIRKGQVLFVLKTREATAIGNNLFPKDTSLQYAGIIRIRASQDGYLTSIQHQLGDYVQEGDSLCSIVDRNSLVFMINVPFEWSKYVRIGLSCDFKLSDGRALKGTIFQKVSVMDMVSQTQSYMAKLSTPAGLPENLIAKVKIYKENKPSSLTVPKSAVLTNEEETQFWVMKVAKDTLAVKIPIEKGIENSERVEILGNSLKAGDRVVSSGNYGLPDSSIIVIQK